MDKLYKYGESLTADIEEQLKIHQHEREEKIRFMETKQDEKNEISIKEICKNRECYFSSNLVNTEIVQKFDGNMKHLHPKTFMNDIESELE